MKTLKCISRSTGNGTSLMKKDEEKKKQKPTAKEKGWGKR